MYVCGAVPSLDTAVRTVCRSRNSEPMRTVNKLRATNKRARLHRWTKRWIVYWREGWLGVWRVGGIRQAVAKVKGIAKRERVGKQRQENGTGNAFSCRICMSCVEFACSRPLPHFPLPFQPCSSCLRSPTNCCFAALATAPLRKCSII